LSLGISVMAVPTEPGGAPPPGGASPVVNFP
jgi:hypothetical protein